VLTEDQRHKLMDYNREWVARPLDHGETRSWTDRPR
jgi:hypothetical protein